MWNPRTGTKESPGILDKGWLAEDLYPLDYTPSRLPKQRDVHPQSLVLHAEILMAALAGLRVS